MARENSKITKEEAVPVTEPVATDVPVEEPKAPKVLTGTVTCKPQSKLNVREEASLQGKILCTILDGVKVQIDPGSSTKEWYRVHTKKGVDGFCMKKYISVK